MQSEWFWWNWLRRPGTDTVIDIVVEMFLFVLLTISIFLIGFLFVLLFRMFASILQANTGEKDVTPTETMVCRHCQVKPVEYAIHYHNKKVIVCPSCGYPPDQLIQQKIEKTFRITLIFVAFCSVLCGVLLFFHPLIAISFFIAYFILSVLICTLIQRQWIDSKIRKQYKTSLKQK